MCLYIIWLQYSNPADEFAISFPNVLTSRIESLFISRGRIIEQFRRAWRSVWVVHIPDLSSMMEDNIRSTVSVMSRHEVQAALHTEYNHGSSDTSIATAGCMKMAHIATRCVLI